MKEPALTKLIIWKNKNKILKNYGLSFEMPLILHLWANSHFD
jgi:hypothetical protein